MNYSRCSTTISTLSGSIFALILLAEGIAKCPIGFRGCRLNEVIQVGGTVATNCRNEITVSTTGECRPSGESCTVTCQDHAVEHVKNTTRMYLPTYDGNGKLISCMIRVPILEEAVEINCPKNDGACTNRDGCE